tara:strand:+ start:12 stop:677 length:666 start_codon:yes stop_codon:yes gene_type:complete
MSAHSIEDPREKLRLKGADFAKNKHKFYAQGTFETRCKVAKIKTKSHIYLYYDKRNEKFKIFKPGKNNDKYLIAEIDEKDIEESIDYNDTRTTDGCIISYIDFNTKKKCEVVITPCDETKRKTKYNKCPVPGRHFYKPTPHLTNWKRLLKLWILESPSRDDVKSKSKPTRKSPSLSTRKSPSASRRKTQSRTQSRRGGSKKYHKATKKHRRKNIKKTRKNK